MKDLLVIGGGAAGFFAAIRAKELGKSVAILEKSRKVLSKVRISGGGRCNVTHACFDPKELVRNYPRGKEALLGPFTRFQPRDTVEWFQERGVMLKTEADGRMFPITDSSETIINCLEGECRRLGVEVLLERDVEKIEPGFTIHLTDRPSMHAKNVIVASGSNRKVYQMLEGLGHTIIAPVPSLFTFNIKNFELQELAGLSVPKATVSVLGIKQTGPLLITHWGFSGPAVLKASAWGARLFHEAGYKAEVFIDWQSDLSYEEKQKLLLQAKEEHAKKQLASICPFSLPNRLWRSFLQDPEKRYSDLGKKELLHIVEKLSRDRYEIEGQTTNKEEFVTAGGVSLNEVNFKTMESKLVPGLFFAGEVLDIDGVTGGFNFQNAWTTGFIAASSAH